MQLTDLREISRRLLQHLLKACHRLGFIIALKYFNLINRHGLSAMSEDDKQEIVSLLIQSFEVTFFTTYTVAIIFFMNEAKLLCGLS